MRGKSSPPYKYKGSRPIKERTQSNQSNTFIFIVFTFLPRYPTFPTTTCYSSLVSMAFEDALTGLPSLGQPYARLPRRGPSRASVRRIVAVVHGNRSDRSTQEVLQGGAPCSTSYVGRSDWLSGPVRPVAVHNGDDPTKARPGGTPSG